LGVSMLHQLLEAAAASPLPQTALSRQQSANVFSPEHCLGACASALQALQMRRLLSGIREKANK
jgi:hypothetical protein